MRRTPLWMGYGVLAADFAVETHDTKKDSSGSLKANAKREFWCGLRRGRLQSGARPLNKSPALLLSQTTEKSQSETGEPVLHYLE